MVVERLREPLFDASHRRRARAASIAAINTTDPAVNVRELRKDHGHFAALDGASFDIQHGGLAWKARLGIALQNTGESGKVTVREQLTHFAGF